MVDKQALIQQSVLPHPPSSRHSLRLWFYAPVSPSEPTVNRLVARADGPYCHCELQFSDDFALTIYMQSPVLLRVRRFSSSNYSCMHIACTRAQEAECRRCAEMAFEQQVPFSVVRMFNAFCRVPFVPKPLNSIKTPDALRTQGVSELVSTGSFCSEICVMALQAGQILPAAIDAAHTTPSELSRLVRDMQEARPVLEGRRDCGKHQVFALQGSQLDSANLSWR